MRPARPSLPGDAPSADDGRAAARAGAHEPRAREAATATELSAPHVARFPRPSDRLGFREALARVSAALSSGAAITRTPGLPRAVVRCAGGWVEVRLSGTDLSIRSSSCVLGNRILSRLNEAGGGWRHDDALVRDRAVRTIVLSRGAGARRRGA